MARYEINTRPTGNPQPPPGGSRRKVIITVVALLVVALGAWRVWAWRASRLPPLTAPPVELAKFVATTRFSELPQEKQEPYINVLMEHRDEVFDAFRSGQITRQQAFSGMRNGMQLAMAKRAREWAAQKTVEDRNAFLDKIIDEREQRAATRPSGFSRPNRDSGGDASNQDRQRGPGRGGGFGPGRMKERIENTPPEQRAEMAEFFAALRKRREERGLSGGGFGGGRGPR